MERKYTTKEYVEGGLRQYTFNLRPAEEKIFQDYRQKHPNDSIKKLILDLIEEKNKKAHRE